ncbi:hypothetical protein NQ317_009620 [Molorchus minor]|uniref:Uncharacterized protein n=1 Tax=Molorchus minor TaxID=1323400 RepID=A0ABQ9JJB5_9CUCU|nr:hypothetical protein NQ317_009620 [Molorchus minor]
MDALSIATEQTLKDINKWLDDTPKFSEFSSASNSPSYTGLDEFDVLASKIDPFPGKKMEKLQTTKKEGGTKDVKRRPFRDPSKFFKRREVQRTIDRLQPGKSKGNLISNVQNTNKVDEIFPLGPLSKIKDTKNSLIVKTDTNAPKLSLGSVLDSFGKHKFVDDQKKEEEKVVVEAPKEEVLPALPSIDNVVVSDKKEVFKNTSETKEDNTAKDTSPTEEISGGGATPNLTFTKKNDSKVEGKEGDKADEIVNKSVDSRKVAVPTASPNPESPLITHGQPVPRQRKISTGSSMSERSSFSQDMDSPRVGIDERGAYPAPYPSPLHRSPSGVSPVMASPRPDISPKAAAYPTINGQIRVGFYQDTVSNKSSPDKSCSPKEHPQSPYAHYSEHVYTPNTTESSYYSYANSPTNPTPPYNTEVSSSSYYDTSKSLTDQYQAKTSQNYTANSPASSHSSPAPHPQHSPNIHSQLSPNIHAQQSPSVHSQQSPGMHSQQSPGVNSPHSSQNSPGTYQQHSPNIMPQNSPGIHPQNLPSVHSPSLQCQNSPVLHRQNSPVLHSQHSPVLHSQHSPSIHPQHSPSIHPQHSPSVNSQNAPNVQPNSPSTDTFPQQDDQSKLAEKVLQQQQNAQSAMFPVKKRAYNETDNLQIDTQRFEIDARLSQRELNKTLHMGQQVNLGSMAPQEQLNKQEVLKQYVHQNIPDPKPLSIQTSMESFTKSSSSPMSQQSQQQLAQIQKEVANLRNMSYSATPVSSPYNSSFNSNPNYPLNIPTARTQQNKIDTSNYTNMGYTGTDENYRSLQQFSRPELNYTRTTVPTSLSQKQSIQQTQVIANQNSTFPNDVSDRYSNPNAAVQQMAYKAAELNNPTTNTQQAHTNFNSAIRSSETITNRVPPGQDISSGYKPDVSIPRPAYNTQSIDVNQTLGLGRNIANLSHIVDRFNNDECMISGLQGSASYYSIKA